MVVNVSDRLVAAAGSLIRLLVYFMLVMPAVIVVGASFTTGDSLQFPPDGLTLKWYFAAINNEGFRTSLFLSLRLAALATICSLVIGFSAAYAIDRYDFRGREGLRSLLLAPLVIPAVVLGLGLLQFLVWTKLNQTSAGLLIGHVVITLPYIVRTLSAGMVLFDRNLEQAAMSLRAPPATVLTTITLPLLAPSLLSAVIFAFVTSFGNVTLSVFLGFGDQVTLPVRIFSYVEHQFDPLIAAISSIVIFITITTIVVIERFAGLGGKN